MLRSLVSMVTEYCWAGRQAAHSGRTALKHIQNTLSNTRTLIDTLKHWHAHKNVLPVAQLRLMTQLRIEKWHICNCVINVNDTVYTYTYTCVCICVYELHSYIWRCFNVLRFDCFVFLPFGSMQIPKASFFTSLRTGRSVIRCLQTGGLSHTRTR